MEDFAQTLQDALPAVPVHLGEEWLGEQPELPLIVVIPAGATYGPSTSGARDAIASGTRDVRVICKAWRFDEAEALADAMYAAALTTTAAPQARLAFRSETWGSYIARVADLTLTLPVSLQRSDITRVHVLTFTQKIDLLPLIPTPEVTDDQGIPQGTTEFSP